MPTPPVPGNDQIRLEDNAIYRLWAGKRAGRRYPARSDFDVLEFAPWLGDIELVDVVRDSERIRYRYRLVGTRITEIDGADLTGKYADEVFGDDLALITREYEEVMRTGEPCLRHFTVQSKRRGFTTTYNKLVLPLAADGEMIDMLLVYLHEPGWPR